MDNFLDDLKHSWQQEKAALQTEVDATTLANQAERYQQNSLRFQYGNVVILSLTLVLYIIFFKNFLLYGTALSKIGFLMMSVPLGIRIVAEWLSILKGRRVHPDDDAMQHTLRMTQYTAFRKWMHGRLTYVVMLLYTAGYYCIMVQFTQLVPAWLGVLMCIAYPVVAWLIVQQVRKGIRKEIDTLEWLSGITKNLQETGG